MSRFEMDTSERDALIPLAMRLKAAYLSFELRIGMTHAMRKYVQPTQLVEKYWMDLAEQVRRAAGESGRRGHRERGGTDET